MYIYEYHTANENNANFKYGVQLRYIFEHFHSIFRVTSLLLGF